MPAPGSRNTKMKAAAYYKGVSGYTYLRLTESRAELLRIPRPGMPKAMYSMFEEEEEIDAFN